MTCEPRQYDVLMLSEAYVTHARRWAQAMAQRGLKVAVLSYCAAPPIPDVETLRFEVPPPSMRYMAGWEGRYKKVLRQILSELRPRLVHMHFLEDWRLSRDLLGTTPLMISAWGSDVNPVEPETPDRRQRKQALLHLANLVTATTPTLADEAARYGQVPLQAIRVIPFGVDTDVFRPADPPPPAKPPVIGFVKHLNAIYGPDVLLRAFRLVLNRHADAKLLMVGDGPLRAELQSLAAELRFAHAVRWLGEIPHDQVARTMQSMHLLAMPSRQEAFGVSALEAQSCGVPVVASNLPGIRQALAAGKTALLVPPDKPEPLAAAILQLLDSPDLRRTMGTAARQFVITRFRWADCVQKMLVCYTQLAPAISPRTR